jgi:hypothetical protein
MRMRPLTPADLEQRKRTVAVRAAARRGINAGEIAELYQMSLPAVERVLTKVVDARLSDPAHLLTTKQESPGSKPAAVQLYWLGFLTAAGHIWGQGAQSTLVITLGEKSEAHMKTFMADLADPSVRFEFCRSSLLGWQIYVRDQALCRALIPWGIPSDFHGDDPALLDDLPEEFAGPFMAGYLDGNWPTRQALRGEDDGVLVLYGAESTLASINRLVRRCWKVAPGAITPVGRRAELCFRDARAGRTIRHQAGAHASRAREVSAQP